MSIHETFDVDGVGKKGSLFGMPFTSDNADLILIPVPWEVTVSYGAGCAAGPEQVLAASPQLDFFDPNFPNLWQKGYFMPDISPKVRQFSDKLRSIAKYYIQWLEEGKPKDFPDFQVGKLSFPIHSIPSIINNGCSRMIRKVYQQSYKNLKAGKCVGVVGGDHSTPLGLMQALADFYPSYSILQIDAHADLRIAYEDFTYSHASIMYNALQIPQVDKLVQVGIRDYSESEHILSSESEGRVKTYYDAAMQKDRFEGRTFQAICSDIVSQLGQKVYISFDIDGLEPSLCPGTGTPVAGGLSMAEAFYLMEMVVHSGREIIGFDLCEVGDSEWDGNVGARVLYKLCTLASVEL